MSDLRHQSTYFESLDGHYAAGFEIGKSFLEGIRRTVSPRVHGDVLDLGNGGLLGFDVDGVATVTVADLCASSLRTVHTLDAGAIRALTDAEHAKLRRVGANAMQLPFRDESFDVVVMSYVAHHMSVASRRDCARNVNAAFGEVQRVLRRGGRFLLLENCPTMLAKAAQEVVFGAAYRILMRFGKPLPYFLSVKQIERMLAGHGLSVRERLGIAWSKRVHSPIFPNIAPPGWLWERVLKNVVFVIEK